MPGKAIDWFKNLTRGGKSVVVSAVVITSLFAAGAAADPPVISTKTVTETEAVAFTTTEHEDENLLVGQTRVITKGIEGEKRVEYRVTYTGDKETARETTNKAAAITKQPTAQVVAKGVKEVVTTITTEAIPFSIKTVQDSGANEGTTRVATQGSNGSKQITHQVIKIRGQEVSRTIVKEEVTAQPTTQVTSIGTKPTYIAPQTASCANGSYINSAGNRICSPSSSSSGATAQCRDGSYSYSQSRRGTCSGHGGVAVWL